MNEKKKVHQIETDGYREGRIGEDQPDEKV